MKELRVFSETYPSHGYPLECYLSERMFSGNLNDRDSDNHIETKVERTCDILAKALTLLRVKNIISDEDIFEIVGIRDYERSREKIRIVEPTED